MKVLLIRPHINKKITTVKKFMFGESMGIECVSNYKTLEKFKACFSQYITLTKLEE